MDDVDTCTVFLVKLPFKIFGLLCNLKLCQVLVPIPTKYINPVFLLVSAVPTKSPILLIPTEARPTLTVDNPIKS